MAPRKEKADKLGGKENAQKVGGNEATDTILTYLRKQNRPYSATDVSANLHNRVTKAAAAKLLKELHERKEIEGRAAGKQMVYHAIQNPSEAASPDDLAAMDATIASVGDHAAAAHAEAKTLRATLATLNSTLSTAELRSTVAALEVEAADVSTRLEALRCGDIKPVTAEEREAADKEGRMWGRVARNRAKIARELWELIAESLPEPGEAAEMRERLGLDDD